MSASATKRLKEQRRREQRRDKDEKRRQRREAARAPAPSPGAEHVDPDIAGIVPGPQPPPEDSHN